MEGLITTSQGIPALLASIAVVLAAHLVFKMGELAWTFLKKKNELSEQTVEKLTTALQINTQAVKNLEARLNDIEKNLAEIPKFKLDLRRIFSAVKYISGDKWADIRKVIMEDEII